jgi:hypothetical protein
MRSTPLPGLVLAAATLPAKRLIGAFGRAEPGPMACKARNPNNPNSLPCPQLRFESSRTSAPNRGSQPKTAANANPFKAVDKTFQAFFSTAKRSAINTTFRAPSSRPESAHDAQLLSAPEKRREIAAPIHYSAVR